MWKLALYPKHPHRPMADTLSSASILPRETRWKNITIKTGFTDEELQFLAPTAKHTSCFSLRVEGSIINTSTGLGNEVPKMMPVCKQDFFWIYSGRLKDQQSEQQLLSTDLHVAPSLTWLLNDTRIASVPQTSQLGRHLWVSCGSSVPCVSAFSVFRSKC